MIRFEKIRHLLSLYLKMFIKFKNSPVKLKCLSSPFLNLFQLIIKTMLIVLKNFTLFYKCFINKQNGFLIIYKKQI